EANFNGHREHLGFAAQSEAAWQYLVKDAGLFGTEALLQIAELVLTALELVLQIAQALFGKGIGIVKQLLLNAGGTLLFDFTLELLNALRLLQCRHFADALLEGVLLMTPGLLERDLELLAQNAGQFRAVLSDQGLHLILHLIPEFACCWQVC